MCSSTHITYRLSPLEYSFPVWEEVIFLNPPCTLSHLDTFCKLFFSSVLTQLWQDALVSWNDIVIKREPALNDYMYEPTNGKPAHCQTPPSPQALFPSDQPGHQQKQPGHREKEHQDLWHRPDIGHVAGNQKVPWPVWVKNPSCWCSIHDLSMEEEMSEQEQN